MLLDSDTAMVVGLRRQMADAEEHRRWLLAKVAACDDNIMQLTARLMDAERRVIEAQR